MEATCGFTLVSRIGEGGFVATLATFSMNELVGQRKQKSCIFYFQHVFNTKHDRRSNLSTGLKSFSLDNDNMVDLPLRVGSQSYLGFNLSIRIREFANPAYITHLTTDNVLDDSSKNNVHLEFIYI